MPVITERANEKVITYNRTIVVKDEKDAITPICLCEATMNQLKQALKGQSEHYVMQFELRGYEEELKSSLYVVLEADDRSLKEVRVCVSIKTTDTVIDGVSKKEFEFSVEYFADDVVPYCEYKRNKNFDTWPPSSLPQERRPIKAPNNVKLDLPFKHWTTLSSGKVKDPKTGELRMQSQGLKVLLAHAFKDEDQSRSNINRLMLLVERMAKEAGLWDPVTIEGHLGLMIERSHGLSLVSNEFILTISRQVFPENQIAETIAIAKLYVLINPNGTTTVDLV